MTRKPWFYPAVFCVVGAVAGFLIGSRVYDPFPGKPLINELHEGQYEFVNPLLQCEDAGALANRELASFHGDIESLIKDEIGKKKARSIAVYFRDLNNGPWFGIDEDERFVPASLLKVPLMMAYLKHAEADPRVLQKKIKVAELPDAHAQVIAPRVALEPGKTYTVEELIERMILFSDNNAARLLQTADNEDYYGRVFTDLGLPPTDPDHPEHAFEVKEYASLFRVLFNASYLSKDLSNRALDLLARADFHGGIRAGVHPDIAVSHKFGERVLGDRDSQFHDCGVVYYPNRPYLLCVMSKGEGLAGLVSTAQDISALVFAEVDRQSILKAR